MREYIETHQFLSFGIGIAVLYLSVVLVVLFWAIRSGQFSNQNHARYLPLEAREIGENEKTQEENRKETANSGKSGF